MVFIQDVKWQYLALCNSGVEGRVVVQAQILSEPDDTNADGLLSLIAC